MDRLIFECNRCPATFNQFKVLVGHYEAHHNQGGKKYGKFRDQTFYKGGDSGCWIATNHLGHPSSCLKCPFRKCIYDEKGVGIVTIKRRSRNEEIIQHWKKGESIRDLAVAFDISQRTIQRVVKVKKEEVTP